MRADEMARLGITCAELAVRGADYRQPLADGMLRILDADAGIGVAQWDLDGDPVAPGSLMTVAGTPNLTAASAAAALAVIPAHPLLSRPDFPVGGASRVSDLTDLASFWDTPAWRLVHGINDGRYPAMVSLGFHGDRMVFVGAQRQHRDFTDDDMTTLDAIREPLTSALAFRAELDRAARRLQELPVDPHRAECPAGETRGPAAGSLARRVASVHLLPDLCGPAASTTAPLTRRECEVLALVAAGWTNRKVGRTLAITERTVRKHLGNVYDKLGVSGRTSAAAWWISGQ